ncbi:energy-coupling factor ABC transporter ATP-binding protein [Vibrio metschnikovii]|uniref:energy-coupling factor ABC transporter ATP-binding protein n=1 Tax=Vibrio metschnikovii TaxID=28172 RepID=UPI002FCA1D6F
MPILLTAHQLSMRFKERGLFHIPALTLGPHEAVYLKGNNGVGKTTLLKILAGLLKPTTGSISHHRSWWQRLLGRRADQHIIYLHQTPYLFDDTVYRNIAYGLRFCALSSQEKRCQVITALRMVGLESLANEHVSVLSGGEKQRVAMARAWILNPAILLMDEPSASLDEESIARLVIMANDLLNRGCSLVITSHQNNPLTELCHKQWWIKEHQLFESPRLHVISPISKENCYVTSISH